MGQRLQEGPWYKRIADVMVRTGCDIYRAVVEENLDVSKEEAIRVFKSRPFQRVLWQARFEYYTEVAQSPQRTKSAMLGLMTLAIENLAKEAEWKEVVEAILKLAKVEGWVGSDASVNVFASLTAKDIEEAKKRLKEIVDHPGPTAEPAEPAESTLPN